MKKIANAILFFLSILFPPLRKSIREDLTEFDNTEFKYVDIERNSKCYCKSGKKYKHCHLVKNEKGKKVALRQIDKDGNEKVIVLDKREANRLKGIFKPKVEVQNTYSEIEVGLGAHSGMR